MKSDEGFSNMLGNHWGFLLWNGNVIPYPAENTLNTKIKQN